MSDAICIAFLAASARSLVFSFAAMRAVFAWANCASSWTRSGLGVALAEGFASSPRTPERTLTANKARTQAINTFMVMGKTSPLMAFALLRSEFIDSIPIPGRIVDQFPTPIGHERAGCILLLIPDRDELLLRGGEVPLFVGGKGDIVAGRDLREVKRAERMPYLEQFQRQRLAFNHYLVNQPGGRRLR